MDGTDDSPPDAAKSRNDHEVQYSETNRGGIDSDESFETNAAGRANTRKIDDKEGESKQSSPGRAASGSSWNGDTHSGKKTASNDVVQSSYPAGFIPNAFNLPEALKPGVRARLEMLFASGKLRRDDLDQKILDSLAEFPESAGSEILDNFSEADISAIRNKSAFLAGVIRRFRAEGTLPASLAPPPMPFARAGHGSMSRLSGFPSNRRMDGNNDSSPGAPKRRKDDEIHYSHAKRGRTDGHEPNKTNVTGTYEPRHGYTQTSALSSSRSYAAHSEEKSASNGAAHLHYPAEFVPNLFNLPFELKPGVRARLEALFVSGKLRKDDLDQKILASLAEFPESAGSEILDNFSEADISAIRNKSAFLAGVIRRFRAEGPLSAPLAPPPMPFAGPAYGGMPSFISPLIPPPLPLLHHQPQQHQPTRHQPQPQRSLTRPQPHTLSLSPSVEAKLESIFQTGLVRREDLDSSCIDQLKALPEHTALEVLKKYSEADLAKINKKGGFFIGILKRFRDQVASTEPNVSHPAYPQLSYSAPSKLESLLSMVDRSELDAKCLSELRNLPEQMAHDIVEKFSQANLSEIRNKSAFFFGIIKRMKMERGHGDGSSYSHTGTGHAFAGASSSQYGQPYSGGFGYGGGDEGYGYPHRGYDHGYRHGGGYQGY